jgi:hypothetical protein
MVGECSSRHLGGGDLRAGVRCLSMLASESAELALAQIQRARHDRTGQPFPLRRRHAWAWACHDFNSFSTFAQTAKLTRWRLVSIPGVQSSLADPFPSQLHWYDTASDTAYFKSYFEESYKTLQKPIWITEVRHALFSLSAPI